jgi:flagellar basal-body rod protein FlgB
MLLDRTGAALERYMDLLSARQKMVAANMANADTPGYQTRDIAFSTEVNDLLGGQPPVVTEVAGLKTKNDGNNVNIDREARLLAENALRFSMASALVRVQLQSLRTAIHEGANS